MTNSTATAVGLRSERGPILFALMLTTGLIAIEATILATAVPSVVADIGEFTRFPWLFSIYLLAQAVSVPLYAKVADMVGRKPVILLGIALFLLGSLLCGLAWDMTSLILFRLVQGLGAGAVAPMAMTIVGDIYTVEERARVQGYIASVWAVSSVVGPTLGGVFSQFASWRWIFLVNIPLCLLAGWALLRFYRETVQKRRHRIDYAGAALLTVGLTAVILALLEGGTAWAWTSTPSIACFAVGTVALAAFAVVERRAAEPVVDFAVLGRRLILTTTLASLAVGALLTGITSFVPTYLEGSAGTAPLLAGLAVAALTLGWPLAASTAGRLYLRRGFRATALTGSAIALVGSVALAVVAPWPNPITVALTAFVIGFGLGWTASPTLIAAQASVDWAERGTVTGMNTFARSAGSAVGVAVFGAIVNTGIASGGGEHDPGTIITAFSWVFVAVAVAAGLLLLVVSTMAKDRPAPPDESSVPAPSVARSDTAS
ncbi:MFS transporter [Saccharothrix coeruleofusca]|uniref:MFS transporter n=1 Tax=Saccharothrix coeruleofusca TaxID=33919 RepID=A0A918EFS2_9PSEU|nr:MFS transporter [Saccharothrix coeruleofusca]MBP2335734.1 EmrB/QacA subfamily drug resistance transporter [Saccharothrix coeruleofusca]GGP75484.1 MFS transporter [Saccharothrix coeruleofusca]